MKDYTKFMKWAVVYFVDRSTQDDRKDKLQVEALFSNPVQAEDNYIIRNKDVTRFIIQVDELERFEEFYNHLNDLKEKYDNYWIFHISDNYTVDEQNKFRTILNAWN